MSKVRSVNGQFAKAGEDEVVEEKKEHAPTIPATHVVSLNVYIQVVVFFFFTIIILTPVLYHIFVKKNYLMWIINLMEREFGCTACVPCVCNAAKNPVF